MLDRAEGPAYIARDAASGAVRSQEWWREGVQQEPALQAIAAVSIQLA
jgi:hypothetical protein